MRCCLLLVVACTSTRHTLETAEAPICDAGYAGDGVLCADLDECAANPCDPLATCVNSVGGFSCVCPEGYAGDGMTCAEIDECAAAPCDVHAECTNTAGSFSCACGVGFAGDGLSCETCPAGLGDGHSCDVDIDECATETCSNGAFCVNTFGSFSCSAPVNECATDNGGCGDPALFVCTDTLLSFRCSNVLAAWWAADGNGYDTGNGLTADVSGVTYASGFRGDAFQFDRTHTVSAPDASAFKTASLTVSAWVRFEGLDGGAATIVGKGGSFALQQVHSGGGDRFSFVGATGTTDVATLVWYHVAGVFDGSTSQLYVNGKLEASASAAPLEENTEPLVIGESFHGRIDEIRVYGRALSALDIEQELVNAAGTPSLWLDAHATHTLTIGAAAAVTGWMDRSGNANDATHVLSPTLVTDGALAGAALRFDGSRLDFPSAAVPSGTEYTMLAAFSRRDGRNGGYFLSTGGGGCNTVNACWHTGYASNTLLNLAQYGNDVQVTVPGYTAPMPELYLGQLHANGRIVQLITPANTYTNTDISTAKLTSGPGHIGYAIAQNTFFKGDIGEVLIYPRALTEAQREGVTAYMRAKWFP